MQSELGGLAKASRRHPQTGPAPAIVLVEPQLGENIGFAIRAMANFGLRDLRLVAPRDGWPNEKAQKASAGADSVVDVLVYEDLAPAIGELNYVLATTARPRDMVKPVYAPDSAAQELRTRIQSGQRCGILFGPERTGLGNDQISLADAIVTAPVGPDFASISLPQTVLLMAYEWLKHQGEDHDLGRITAFDGPASEGLTMRDTRPATREELLGFFEHLERELDCSGFLRPPEKRASMVRNLRNMFHRLGATEQDVRTLRGIVSSLVRSHEKGGREPS
jgi:tRNA/rRNA methyltransferase